MRAGVFFAGLVAALIVAPTAPLATVQTETDLAPPGRTVEALRADDRTLGSPDAPITLTVYLSTTCSHCAAWHTDDFPTIRERYVDTGQVRVVFRDLLTPPVGLSLAGAVLARCATGGAYDAVLDGLFRAQSEHLARGKEDAWLMAGAVSGGLTYEAASACLADETRLVEVETRSDQAEAEGVLGTPAFFINGRRVLETRDRDIAAFDALLKPLLPER